MIKEQETIDTLEKLGFKAASEKIKRLAAKKRKLVIAYEHFRFVRKEKIEEFNKKLYAKRESDHKYQQLGFTSIEHYLEVPPEYVFDAMIQAVEKNCFDGFEVASIVSIVKVPDPILFGVITGCTDKFFIAQWNDDVKIEDILGANEG